jgi:hypothetical protein
VGSGDCYTWIGIPIAIQFPDVMFFRKGFASSSTSAISGSPFHATCAATSRFLAISELPSFEILPSSILLVPLWPPSVFTTFVYALPPSREFGMLFVFDESDGLDILSVLALLLAASMLGLILSIYRSRPESSLFNIGSALPGVAACGVPRNWLLESLLQVRPAA